MFSLLDFAKSQEYFDQDRKMFFSHNDGISPKTIKDHPYLEKNLIVIGTTLAENGKEFASIIEFKEYPFIGIQFHPDAFQFNVGPKMDSVDFKEQSLRAQAETVFKFKRFVEFYEFHKNYSFPKKYESYLVENKRENVNRLSSKKNGVYLMERVWKSESKVDRNE